MEKFFTRLRLTIVVVSAIIMVIGLVGGFLGMLIHVFSPLPDHIAEVVGYLLFTGLTGSITTAVVCIILKYE